MFLLSPTWHLMMFGGGYMRGVSRDLESLGTVDAGTLHLMQGSTNAMSGMNGPVLLVTILILAAPLAIMLWKSKSAANAVEHADA